MQKSVLDNGLRVLSENVPGVDSVALGLWISAGSRWEPDPLAGISHLVEHLMFKGTKLRSTKELAAEIDLIGGNLNAYTTKEYTCYSARVLSANLSRALGLLSEMMLQPRFDPQEIEREKLVILEELSMYEDSPDDLVHDLIGTCLWRGQPLGRPVIGSRESIISIQPPDILDFYRRYYTPRNSVLVAVGKVDHQQLIDEVGKSFAQWTDAGPIDWSSWSAPRITAGRCIKVKDVEQVHLCLGFQGVPLGDDTVYRLLVLSTLLGGGTSSRLFQKIREERGMAYSVYSYQCSYRDTGLLGIYSATSPDRAKEMLDLILAEIENLRRQPPPDDELQRAKALIKTELVLGLESPSSRMNRIGSSELLLGEPLDPQEAVRQVDSVDNEDIVKLAQQVLVQDQMAIACVAPVTDPFGTLQLEVIATGP